MQSSADAASTASDPTEALRIELRAFRGICFAVLVALILLALGVNIFMLRQVGLVRRQAAELRQFVTDYEVNSLPIIDQFVRDLRQFSQTNPDFAPILAKYVSPPEGQKVALPPPASKTP